MLKDDFLYNQGKRFFNYKCKTCKKFYHETSKCSYLHYVPCIDRLIINSQMENTNEKRVETWHRSRYRKQKEHTLKII